AVVLDVVEAPREPGAHILGQRVLVRRPVQRDGRDAVSDFVENRFVHVFSSCCNSRHKIFPVFDFGSCRTNSTKRGALYTAIASRHQRISSIASSDAPGFSTTSAFTASPWRASRVAITQASCTAGWPYSVFSTSAGHTL